MENIQFTTENTSHGWSVENIKKDDKILVCNNTNIQGWPLTTCDRHIETARVANVTNIEKFGGVFFVSTSEGEMSLTRYHSVTFFGA